MKTIFLLITLLLPLSGVCKYYVYNLATDMLYETDVVFCNGQLRPEIRIEDMELFGQINPEVAEIRSEKPRFSWMIFSDKNNTYQTKYRIQLASSVAALTEGNPDMWDSGDVVDSASAGIVYRGKKLKTSTVYYWRVKIVDNRGRKYQWSKPKAFLTAADLDNSPSVMPLVKTEETPATTVINPKSVFADFSRDAFSQLKLRVNSQKQQRGNLIVHLGELAEKNTVNTAPGFTIRYSKYILPLQNGENQLDIVLNPDARNTDPNQNEMGVSPVLMPSQTGEVLPFRYCFLEGDSLTIDSSGIVRYVVHYPFNEKVSFFESSDTVLNQVYDLCKWTMKATSFCGVFVDGDRERIPYEADALINQLSYFAVNNEYSISRNTVDRLVFNPTWPTEWILQTLLIAWNDYLYSGDDALLMKTFYDLKYKSLNELRNYGDNLIHTGNSISDVKVFEKLHFKGSKIRDIVDWPQISTDGYKFEECNTVVNEYYYAALKTAAKIARAVSNDYDAQYYEKLAAQTKKSVNSLLRDTSGLYVDGLKSKHKSLHANMFALAFGMVPQKDVQKVADFVVSRGMACSVYGSQFLLDALYNAGFDVQALNLMRDTTVNSWYNMIRSGSTMTMEAWDNSQKNNCDWNHAWGAAALNVIVRKLAGVEPLEPGFKRVKICPMPGNLQRFKLRTPSPKGNIEVSYTNLSGKKTEMTVVVPPNVTAEVCMPGTDIVKIVGSGKWRFRN